MKKSAIIVLLAGLLTILSGCRRAKSNGEIDGFWRVVSVEMLSDGTITQEGNIFFGIQLELFQLNGGAATGEMHYDKHTKTMSVDFRNPDPLDWNRMHRYGIYDNPVSFKVDFPRHNKMILTTDKTIITCTRY